MTATILSSCQLNYLWHVSYNHLSMLNSKESIDSILSSDRVNEEQKNKIRLSQEVRVFAFEKLQLKKTKNYSEYVDLKRPYVTYTVTASQKWKFEPYLWNFPIIGKAPYKGFYSEAAAKEEATELEKKNLDVTTRGVSAYSTLGKMTDPLLSSMLNYPEHILTNTIIHELVHTTLFIKDNIDFNERLAVFVANKGTEIFYLEKEGKDSPTLKRIQDENHDDELFSAFITAELDQLKKWYENFDPTALPQEDQESVRRSRLDQIALNFEKNLKPKLRTRSYERLFGKQFNNADLSIYNTYMKSLDMFETVYQHNGANIPQFLKKCEELNKADNAEAEFEKWAQDYRAQAAK
nr:aminopeptidase [Pseudobdellovibrio exovorus]